MDPLRKVSRGEKRTSSAAQHNALVTAARKTFYEQFVSRVLVESTRRSGLVRVRNASGSPVPRYGVLGLGGMVIEPDAGEESFNREPCFEGVTPSTLTRNWCVVQRPLAPGAIGFAKVHGMTRVRMQVSTTETAHSYAEVAGSTDHVRPVESGQAEILWRETGTGDKRAYVRIGNTPSTGEGQQFFAIVKAPSTDGEVLSSYTVDIYGATAASLNEAPTIVGAVALQEPASLRYWRAEVVGVTRSGGVWRIQKAKTMPAFYQAGAGIIGMRLATHQNIAASQTNFVIDVAAVTPLLNGGESTAAWLAFGIGPYGGIGRFDEGSPVRLEPGWNLCSLLAIAADNTTAHRVHVVPFNVSSVTNGQESFSGFSGTGYAQSTTMDPGPGYRYLNGQGNVIQAVTLGADVSSLWAQTYNAVNIGFPFLTITSGSSSVVWPLLPALPSITGAVQSLANLLGAHSAGTSGSGSTSSPPVTKNDPNGTGARPFSSGGPTLPSGSFVVFTQGAPWGISITASVSPA